MIIKLVIRLLALFLFLSNGTAFATVIIGTPTATFGPGNTLTGWSATIGASAGAPIVPPAPGVTIQYTNGTGTPIGAPIPVTVGPGGVITAPPPPIPAGATGLGNKVIITDPVFGATKPLVWYDSNWIWGVTPAIKIDPIGLPGISTQHWFIEDTGGADLIGNDSVFGTRSLSVINSGFDLSYSLISGSLYDVIVDGVDSFIELSDHTYVSFVDGSSFGTIDIGVAAISGSFNFSAIGLSGLWLYDSATNYTGATANVFSPFNAPAITAVPEPITILLLASGLFCLFWVRTKPSIIKLKDKKQRRQSTPFSQTIA